MKDPKQRYRTQHIQIGVDHFNTFLSMTVTGSFMKNKRFGFGYLFNANQLEKEYKESKT